MWIIIFLSIVFLFFTLFSTSNPFITVIMLSLLALFVLSLRIKFKNNNSNTNENSTNNKYSFKNIILGLIYFIVFFIVYYFSIAFLLMILLYFISLNSGNSSDNGLWAYGMIFGITIAPILSIITTFKIIRKNENQ